MKNFNDISRDEIRKIIFNRADFDSMIFKDQFFAEKILCATKLFFEYSKNNFNMSEISETKFLLFLSILELESIKEKGSFFANQKLIKTQHGPVPSKINDFINELDFSCPNERYPIYISNKSLIESREIKLLSFNDYFLVFDEFLSSFDKVLINKVSEIVLVDLNENIKDLSNYMNLYTSWKKAATNKTMNLFEELEDEDRKIEMEAIYS